MATLALRVLKSDSRFHGAETLRILAGTLVVWGSLNLLLWVGVNSQRKPHTLFHGVGMLLIGAGYMPGGFSEKWTRQVVLATGWIAIIVSSELFRRSLTNVKTERDST